MFIRFFNGALGLAQADIFVNNELVVAGLAYGAFSPFHEGRAGVYNIEVRVMGQEDSIVFTDLVNTMDDVAYTIALSGSADGASFAVAALNLNEKMTKPNIRFVNLVPYDSVLDVDIDGRRSASGLMFNEYSEDINIFAGEHSVAVYDDFSQKFWKDGFFVQAGKVYLAMIIGNMGDAQYPPALVLGEDMPQT